MNSTAGKVIIALCVVTALGAFVVIYSLFPAGAGGQAAAELPDTGKLRVGSALGHERAGFAGRPTVQIFTAADAPHWPAMACCLQIADVDEQLGPIHGRSFSLCASWQQAYPPAVHRVSGLRKSFWRGQRPNTAPAHSMTSWTFPAAFADYRSPAGVFWCSARLYNVRLHHFETFLSKGGCEPNGGCTVVTRWTNATVNNVDGPVETLTTFCAEVAGSRSLASRS